MEVATWVIAIFTIILTFATIAYAIVTFYALKASKQQTEALKDLSAAIREIPITAFSLERRKEIQKKINEEKAKTPTPHQKTLGRK